MTSERASCFVCVRAFNAFRRRHSCRMCGEVVCSKCSLFKRVDVHIGENKVRICSGCYLAYRKSHETGVAIAAPVLTLPAPTEDYNGVSAAIRAAMAATETARREEGARRAAIKAKNFASEHAARLEKEVAQGKTRVEELENVVAGIKQHQGKETLSKEQEKELQDAKKMISILQHRLRTQEKMSREAAESAMEFTGDASAAKLRKKLQKMERQLIQAGLNVVEDIPYDEAKQKINSISTRMQEIGSSEVQCEDKTKQSALRKEYFELEQQMERYNTALMMTDEYINEQNDKERAWNDANEIANRNALERLRGCIPVDLCNLSEKGLLGMETPSGASLELALARRLKRTNILELLRVDPETIKRMHPSVIEGFRPNGLSIDERRALHAVLHGPYLDWKKRKVEELSNRKFMWYEKLLVTFKNALEQYTNHVAKYATDDDTAPHTCDLIGRQCPVKADGVISKLYAVDFGFPIGDVYHVKEVLKSDPDGAGEKALAEAQAHANVMVANQRSKQLKDHYGMKVRQVSQAAGFMEELDATLEAMDKAEEVWAVSFATSRDKPWTEEVESYLSAVQDMKLIVLKVGERSAMNMSGKRDATKDGKDTRAEIEIQLAIDVLAYMEASLNDIKTRIKSFAETRKYRGSLSQVEALLDLLVEIQTRNRHTCIERSTDTYIPVFKRRPWSARVPAVIAPKKVEIHRTSSAPSPSKGLPPPNPLKKALLSSIATRSKVEVGLPREDDGRKAPVDMLAAIKARKKKPSSCPNLLDLNPGGSNRNDMLLEALQNRNKTLSSNSAA